MVTTRNVRRLVTDRGGWVRNGDRWRVTERHHDGALADERTTAEALYVGLTRGRRENTAMVICEPMGEHERERPEPVVLLIAALCRGGTEGSARRDPRSRDELASSVGRR